VKKVPAKQLILGWVHEGDCEMTRTNDENL